MNSNEAYYLTEVLGVQGLMSSFDNRQPSVELLPQLSICTPFEPSTSERAMIDKMLEAVQIKSALFFNLDQSAWENVEHESLQRGVRFGLIFGLSIPSASKADSEGEAVGPDIKWIELPSVARFLDEANPVQLKKIKSSAWEQLKRLKREMEILK